MLRAIYKTGSQCILPNSNDKDYVKVYDLYSESREALKHNHDHSVDYHFDGIDKMPRVFLGCYIYPFMELVEGEEIETLKNFSIFEHKDEYVALLKRELGLREASKQWYHILIACYMFANKKMSLTKTQLKKVQEVHDNGITQELKEYCINTLNEIKWK